MNKQLLDHLKCLSTPEYQIPRAADESELTSAELGLIRKYGRWMHALERQAIATGQFSTPTNVDYSNDGTIALVSISMQGEGVDAKAVEALQTDLLRCSVSAVACPRS